MTKQEAIELLMSVKWNANIDEQEDKALSMAIEALTHFNSTSNSIKNELNELSCSESPNRSDVISRQDAIYYVKQATIGETDVMKAWVKAQTHLMRLPSAQPSNEYDRGWKDGQEALREEMWEYERDRLD